jgi:hypothetical protein
VRTLTMAEGGGMDAPQVLICDRDRKWSGDVSIPGRGDSRRPHLERVPNANAYAKRFVRSIKEECPTANGITRDSARG